MISSAIFLAIIGILLSFLPNEILIYLNIDTNQILTILLQILGSLYLGFAILNWMAKGTLIGGIYNKPIAIGNLMHFAVGSIALIKIANKVQVHSKLFLSLTIVYVIFAILFFLVFRKTPNEVEKL